MGKKNDATIDLMRIPEFFADACNLAVYHGVEKIKASDLRDLDTREIAVMEKFGREILTVEKHRDLMKAWERLTFKTDGKVIYALLGIELQSEIDYAIVVRVLLYDALRMAAEVSKRAQENRKDKKVRNRSEFLSGFMKDDKILPVVTVVVYFGKDKWDGATSTKEIVDCDDPELLACMVNYKLNLIQPQMPDEELELLQSHLRELLLCIKHPCDSKEDRDQFKQMVKANPRFKNLPPEIVRVLNEFSSFKLETQASPKKGELAVDLKAVMDDIEAEGRAKGLAEGRAEGKAEGRAEGILEGKKQMILNMRASGLSLDQIVRISGMSLEYIQGLA